MASKRTRVYHSRVCMLCNRDFEASRCDAKLCSPQCRKRASRIYASDARKLRARQMLVRGSDPAVLARMMAGDYE